jgi:UDP-N-acetylglucosamine 2-epimerase
MLPIPKETHQIWRPANFRFGTRAVSSIYINDLEANIDYWEPTFFADGTSIFIIGNSTIEIQKKTSLMISNITVWFDKNQLTINKQKTTVTAFHRSQKLHLECPPIKIYDTVINYTAHSKFLGVRLNKHLRWNMHMKTLTNNLSKVCFGLG